jgi:serine/threonine protein kinase
MVNLTQYAAARDEIRKTIRDKYVKGITSDWCGNCSTFPSQVQESHAKGKCEFAYCEICPVDVPRRLLHDNPNLLSDLWESSVDDRSPNTEADIDKFRERVCGNKTDPVTSGLSRCLVAFVLDIETPEAEEWQAFIHLCMDDESQLKDGDLPLSHVSYESHFSRQGSKFLSTQYRFCPVSVKQNEISPYIGADAGCRRPYTIQRQLGSGAYGTVHEVQFTTQQFFFEDTGSVNRVGQCYAVKHIRLDEKYDREWDAATALLDCNRQHTTIMHTLAAIRYPGHLSLFYHVATCDLAKFMADEPPPANLAARRQMLSKMVDIADAISFLHDGLSTSKGVKIHCYHLDLKPGNVLVVAGENRPDSLAFKLADFGVSSIKRGDASWDLRSLFRTQPATSLVDSAKNTWGLQNGAGVCLAPEASEPSSGVNSAADVWSFCAMLSIFIAWVSNGVSGIEDFSKARLCFDGPFFKTDQFFKTRESSATRLEDGPFERKEEVDKWYEGLESPRSGREGAELSLYGQLWLVVQEGLEPQPLRRPIMCNVYATLNNMLKLEKPYDRSLLFPQGSTTDAYRPDLRGGTHPKILDDWRYVKREELQTRLFSFCARPRGRGRERHEWFLLYGRSGSGKSHACFNLCETEETRYVKTRLVSMLTTCPDRLPLPESFSCTDTGSGLPIMLPSSATSKMLSIPRTCSELLAQQSRMSISRACNKD